MLESARRRLPLVHFAVDSILWMLAIPLAFWLHCDYDTSLLGGALLVPVLLAVVLQGLFGLALGLCRRKWRYGTFDEVCMVAFTAGFVGVGDGAEQVLRTLRASSDSAYLHVAMLDDDPSKRNLRLSGVRVEGRVDDLTAVAARHHADAVLVAVPSADSSFIRRVSDLAGPLKLKVLVLPVVDHVLGGVGADDIRPVNEADLLGRRPADIDPDAVAGDITGKRVLVTGAGGSIGSEPCRQLARL